MGAQTTPLQSHYKKIRNSREQNRRNIRPITDRGERLDNPRVCRLFKKINYSNWYKIFEGQRLIRIKVIKVLELKNLTQMYQKLCIKTNRREFSWRKGVITLDCLVPGEKKVVIGATKLRYILMIFAFHWLRQNSLHIQTNTNYLPRKTQDSIRLLLFSVWKVLRKRKWDPRFFWGGSNWQSNIKARNR